ncbi:hypothetical protein [Nitrospira sp. KM1]|uniref:hypothetical protein n=1 Tax=Nitrospira sp. KM1 TaxID=1936990 RepID=UPI001564E59D|nr:hypothetical protein [Nitrospira sp. KM1]
MTTAALTLAVALFQSPVEGATARTAKDAGERSKAVATAARYLQGAGFIDPMLAAENVNDSLLAVEVDHKSWSRLDKGQKLDFLDRINGGALNANGGVAIDIHVSMNGSKVAASTFAAGQQVIRLLE